MSRPFVRHAGYLVQPLPDTTPEGLAGFHFILKRSYDVEPGGQLRARERQRVLNHGRVIHARRLSPAHRHRNASGLTKSTGATFPVFLCNTGELCPIEPRCGV